MAGDCARGRACPGEVEREGQSVCVDSREDSGSEDPHPYPMVEVYYDTELDPEHLLQFCVYIPLKFALFLVGKRVAVEVVWWLLN